MRKNKKAPTLLVEGLRGYISSCITIITNPNTINNDIHGYTLPINYKAANL